MAGNGDCSESIYTRLKWDLNGGGETMNGQIGDGTLLVARKENPFSPLLDEVNHILRDFLTHET